MKQEFGFFDSWWVKALGLFAALLAIWAFFVMISRNILIRSNPTYVCNRLHNKGVMAVRRILNPALRKVERIAVPPDIMPITQPSFGVADEFYVG